MNPGYSRKPLKPAQRPQVPAPASRCVDAVVIVLSLWLAYWLRGLDNAELYLPVGLVALPFYLLAGGGAPLSGRSDSRERLQEIRRALAAWAWTLAGLLVVAWTSKITADYSRVAIGLWTLFGALGLTGWRLAWRPAKSRDRTATDALPAAIAGAGERAGRFARFIQSTAALQTTVAGCFAESGRDAGEPGVAGAPALPMLGGLDDLVKRAAEGEFSTIFVALPPDAEDSAQRLVAALCDTPASVYVVPSAHAEELAHARWVDCEGLPLVSIFETPYSGVNSWAKRAEDVLLALSMLLVAAAPMLAIAAAVKLTSPGPVLFRQRRHGMDGREIGVLKFRTMTVIEDGGDVSQAVQGDSRYTPIGAFLRHRSLDELPQIFNVLRGDMSVVGPRPHAVSVNRHYRKLIPGYMLRHRVKPGITGWAQIHGLRGSDSPENMEKRVRYDLWYLTRWSLWLDLWIVVRSIPALAGHRNAF